MAETPQRDAPGRRGDAAGARLLLVGARRQVRRLAGCLDRGPLSGLTVVGFVDLSGRGRQLVVHPRSAPVPILGRIDRLAEVVEQSGATDLVVALTGRPAQRVGSQLRDLSKTAVRVHWVDGEADAPAARDRPSWASVPAARGLRWGRVAKRGIDIAAALAGLLILSPALLVIAALILLTTGRPIFYTQERIGRGGRPFRIIKFRSMKPDAETSTGPVWATDHDVRCTPLGDWLRHTNVDELPQLLNVLSGDMSLVGPRPERPSFVEQFRREYPEYDDRHAVPSGMTGWAQVHGWRGRTSLRKRLQYDRDYITRWSLGLDLQILWMTVQHVAIGRIQWGDRESPTSQDGLDK